MKRQNLQKLIVGVLAIIGLFLFLVYAFCQNVEVTQPEEAPVSSPVESEEKAAEKLPEIKLILSAPQPAFWVVS